MELALMQPMAGRLFVFEHPAGATSWSTHMMDQVAQMEGIYKVTFDFCAVGMTVAGQPGEPPVPAKKRTRVLTNSHAVHTLLREAQCNGQHWHMVLLDGKAGPCQEYPEKFCRLICEGIRRELDTLEWKRKLYEVFDVTTPFGKLMKIQESLDQMATPPEEIHFNNLMTAASSATT